MKLSKFKFFPVIIFLISSKILTAQLTTNNDTFSYTAISAFKFTQVCKNTTSAFKFSLSAKPLQLFIFLSPECPLSKNYTATLNKLYAQYSKQVEFYGCISGKGFTTAEIQSFISTYKIAFPLLLDETKKFTNYIAATVTPEVVLLNKKGEEVYKGAIDDWVQDLGKKKLTVSKYYLNDAITALLNNKEVPVKKTKAYGCLINDY